MADRTLLMGVLSFAGIPLVKIETSYCGENCGPLNYDCRGHMQVKVLPNDLARAKTLVRMLRHHKGIDAKVSPII